jgi:endogenous inhibitor of DNA gyrase (YacG/DUF329 family)
MSANKHKIIACPSCKQPTNYSPENPFRPFCSQRCKLIDLGLWASEQYAIPAVASEDDNESGLSATPYNA